MNNQRISRDEMIALVIDSKYSIDAQIAILRQKDEKPEDYAEFYAFAEEVKRKVTEEYDHDPDAPDDPEVDDGAENAEDAGE